MLRRLVAVAIAVLLGLFVTACSSAEMTFVPEGSTYTAVTVEGLATSVEKPSFAGSKSDDVATLRHEQLAALRSEGASAAALADILTNEFPTDTASVPYYAEAAVVDGQDAWVVLEMWSSSDGMLDKQRLWVLTREGGDIILSSVFN